MDKKTFFAEFWGSIFLPSKKVKVISKVMDMGADCCVQGRHNNDSGVREYFRGRNGEGDFGGDIVRDDGG